MLIKRETRWHNACGEPGDVEQDGMRERLAWIMTDTEKKSRTVLTDKQWRAVCERRKKWAGAVCVCLYVGERCVCVCVCQRETSVLADADWQEGAAGMWLTAALCGTGTNCSIIAWESNRYGQIITWSEGTRAQAKYAQPLRFFLSFFFGGEWLKERWIMMGEEECLIVTGWGLFDRRREWCATHYWVMCCEEVTSEGSLFCRRRIVKGPVCRIWRVVNCKVLLRASVWFVGCGLL